jgi:Rv0078B-related antitoxin
MCAAIFIQMFPWESATVFNRASQKDRSPRNRYTRCRSIFAPGVRFIDLATTDLADAIFREKVLWARQQTPAEKWALCFELHELAIATMRSGIAAQHPELDAAGIAAELDRRLRLRRQIEDHGIYVPIPDEAARTP